MKKLSVGTKIAWILLLIVMPGWGAKAGAEIQLTDCFSVTGFLRHELGVHVGGQNPNNPDQDNYDFTLSRTWFQTEWTYTPVDRFKLFAKVRLMSDTTEDIDHELSDYDAFPLDVPEDDWTMLQVSDDQWRGEIWELYTDLEAGKLWLRLGRQQIVWGEMISTRLMDIINPLDYSRNFIFDPEEFENIRIPTWMLRARCQLGQAGGWLKDVAVEGFVNPGDVIPNQMADTGAPWNIMPVFPSFVHIREKDRRGDVEYGVRMGGMIGGFYLTLNYLYVYSDDFLLDFASAALRPLAVTMDARYPSADIFGITWNYFIASFNTVATFEGTWVPDQPYQDAGSLLPAIDDQGTWNYAVRFDRQTFVFPRPTSAMMIQVQFQQTIREGDEDDILGAGLSRVDKTDEMVALIFDQYFHYNDYRVTLLGVYDLDGAHYLKPQLRYTYGTHWYFDLYAAFLGGEENRPGRFGALTWGDQVLGRVTYQF